MEQKEILDLKLKANKVRQLIIETLVEAKSGHSGGPLGMADIFTAMYFKILRHDPKNPSWEDRDRLVLSNGHICPVLYCTMALNGYFPIEELKTLRKINSRLQGHPHRTALPGLESTSGPLGEGLSQSIGMALAGRMDKKDYYVYCLTSDGEHQEGNIWEAAMAAGKYKLNHLIQVIDYNNIQIDGNIEDVMPLEPFRAKYESFNWATFEVDGNDMEAFLETIEQAKKVEGKPVIVIAKTIPGKGVGYMEGNYKWHGNPPGIMDVDGAPPKDQQGEVALNDLKKIEEELHAQS